MSLYTRWIVKMSHYTNWIMRMSYINRIMNMSHYTNWIVSLTPNSRSVFLCWGVVIHSFIHSTGL